MSDILVDLDLKSYVRVEHVPARILIHMYAVGA